ELGGRRGGAVGRGALGVGGGSAVVEAVTLAARSLTEAWRSAKAEDSGAGCGGTAAAAWGVGRFRRCSSITSRRAPSPPTMWRAAQVRGRRIESEVERDLSRQSERGGTISG